MERKVVTQMVIRVVINHVDVKAEVSRQAKDKLGIIREIQAVQARSLSGCSWFELVGTFLSLSSLAWLTGFHVSGRRSYVEEGS